MRGSTRMATLLWFPAVRARVSGVPLTGTDCTWFSLTVMPAGAVQLSVYTPGCGPLDLTCKLVGPGILDVAVTAGVVMAVVRVATTAPSTVGVPVAVGLPPSTVGVPVGVAVAVGPPLIPWSVGAAPAALAKNKPSSSSGRI